MKAYHEPLQAAYFICSLCQESSASGDMFYFAGPGAVLCKRKPVHLHRPLSASTGSLTDASSLMSSRHSLTSCSSSSLVERSTENGSNAVRPCSLASLVGMDKSGKRLNGNKPTRARTILTARQLHALRTCYMTNPKPDATTRSKLCQMTGLQPRVVRVWFQNKRCKDKRKAMQAMKKAEESQRKGSSPHSQSASVDHGSTILSSSNSGAQMPGSDGSCLPPLPSIPTITTAETDFRQNAINIIPVPSSCSQPKETFLHSLPSCNEVFTPNLPVNGCSFGDLQPVGPPKFSDTLSAYYQQQMFNAAPYQQSADCTPNWEDLLGHHQLFDDQPLPYSSHTTGACWYEGNMTPSLTSGHD